MVGSSLCTSLDVASWREGGSRKPVQQEEEEERLTPTPPSSAPVHVSSEDEDSSQAYHPPPPASHPLPIQNAMPCMMRPGVGMPSRMGPPGAMMFGPRMPPFVSMD